MGWGFKSPLGQLGYPLDLPVCERGSDIAELCGHVVEPMPMSAPSGRPCANCAGILRTSPDSAR